MNTLIRTLLGSTALCVLATAPAVAGSAPKFHVTALHRGRVVNKTRLQNPVRGHFTYTFGVYTYVSSASLNKTVTLTSSFYKFDSSCSFVTPVRVKAPKKSEYGKIGWTTETYSDVCTPGPNVFYGNTYKLTNPDGKGHTDHFVSTQIFQVKRNNRKYKGTLHSDVNVFVE